MQGFGEDDYIIVDCPGQIELFTHIPVLRTFVDFLKNDGWTVCAVFCLDSHFISDSAKFIAGCFQALSAMVTLELPHVNVLTKVDLLEDKVCTPPSILYSVSTQRQRQRARARALQGVYDASANMVCTARRLQPAASQLAAMCAGSAGGHSLPRQRCAACVAHQEHWPALQAAQQDGRQAGRRVRDGRLLAPRHHRRGQARNPNPEPSGSKYLFC